MNQKEFLINKDILNNIHKNLIHNLESASDKAFYYIPFAIKVFFQKGETLDKEKKEIKDFYFVFFTLEAIK